MADTKQLRNPREDCCFYSYLSKGCSALTSDTCDNCKFYKKHKSDINRNEKLREKFRSENLIEN